METLTHRSSSFWRLRAVGVGTGNIAFAAFTAVLISKAMNGNCCLETLEIFLDNLLAGNWVGAVVTLCVLCTPTPNSAARYHCQSPWLRARWSQVPCAESRTWHMPVGVRSMWIAGMEDSPQAFWPKKGIWLQKEVRLKLDSVPYCCVTFKKWLHLSDAWFPLL